MQILFDCFIRWFSIRWVTRKVNVFSLQFCLWHQIELFFMKTTTFLNGNFLNKNFMKKYFQYFRSSKGKFFCTDKYFGSPIHLKLCYLSIFSSCFKPSLEYFGIYLGSWKTNWKPKALIEKQKFQSCF